MIVILIKRCYLQATGCRFERLFPAEKDIWEVTHFLLPEDNMWPMRLSKHRFLCFSSGQLQSGLTVPLPLWEPHIVTCSMRSAQRRTDWEKVEGDHQNKEKIDESGSSEQEYNNSLRRMAMNHAVVTHHLLWTSCTGRTDSLHYHSQNVI